MLGLGSSEMFSREEKRSLPLVLGVLDVSVILLAFSFALYLRFSADVLPLSIGISDTARYMYLMLGLLPIWWLSLAYFRSYSPQFLMHGNDEYQRVANASTFATVLTMVVIFLLKADFARGWVLLSWVTGAVFLMFGRWLHRRLHRWRISRTGRKVPVVLIGANHEAKKLAEDIEENKTVAMTVVGAISWPMREPAEGLNVLGNLEHLGELIKEAKAEVALVVPSALPAAFLQQLYHQLTKTGVSVFVSPSLFDIVASRVAVMPISDTPLIRLEEVHFTGIKYAIKRATDIFGAVVLSISLAPLFIFIGIMIKLGSPGPIFFRQERVGRRGQVFRIFKFRTMIYDAEAQKKDLEHLNEATGPIFKIREDPRITEAGKWLRRFSLDELPQLFNVWPGHMSLVGPRPPTPDEVEAYGDWEMRRLEVSPGMTGFWQVRGRSDTTFEEMVRLDLYYIENWSISLDTYILFRTIGVVLSAKGAY